MKLNQEQIAKIDETLVLNKVVYDDIKLELTDHIASDIEEIMMNQEITFGVALKEAFEKWKPQLKESNSFWSPIWKYGPKTFIDKWAQQTKKHFLYTVSLSLFTTFFVLGINRILKKDTLFNIIDEWKENVGFIIIFLLIAGRLLIFTSKIKTTYGNMFNVYCVFSIVFVFSKMFSLNLFHHYSVSIKLAFIRSFFDAFYIIYAISTFRLLYKHFEFERKLSKV